jgi:hypothetical protein
VPNSTWSVPIPVKANDGASGLSCNSYANCANDKDEADSSHGPLPLRSQHHKHGPVADAEMRSGPDISQT